MLERRNELSSAFAARSRCTLELDSRVAALVAGPLDAGEAVGPAVGAAVEERAVEGVAAVVDLEDVVAERERVLDADPGRTIALAQHDAATGVGHGAVEAAVHGPPRDVAAAQRLPAAGRRERGGARGGAARRQVRAGGVRGGGAARGGRSSAMRRSSSNA